MEYQTRIDQHYLESVLPGLRHPVFVEMEGRARRENFPIIGPVCGQLCSTLVQVSGVRQIFEMGSGFGYSTAWFAQALEDNEGCVHHTVNDSDLAQQAKEYLARMGLLQRVKFHLGNAIDLLREQQELFDLIFIDIDKEQYPEALQIAKSKLRPEGLLVIDNALWGGRVIPGHPLSAEGSQDVPDQATRGVLDLNRTLANDPDWTGLLIPLRDGMWVLQLRGPKN